MQMPDVTKAQLIALVQAIIAVLVAFSVPISEIQSAALLGMTTVLATVLIAGDAAIRRGRAKIAEAKVFKELEMKRTAAAHISLEANKEEEQKDM